MPTAVLKLMYKLCEEYKNVSFTLKALEKSDKMYYNIMDKN